MAPSSASRTIILVTVVTLAIVCAGFGGYAFWRQLSRTRYFSDSRLRELGVLSDQIQAAIVSRQNALRSGVAQCPHQGTAWERCERDLLAPQLKLAGLELTDCPKRLGKQTSHLEIRPSERPKPRQTSSAPRGRTTREEGCAVQIDGDALFVAVPTPKQDSETKKVTTVSATGKTPDNREKPVCAQIFLGDLLKPFTSDGDFDGSHVFIAEKKSILFDRGPTEVRLNALEEGWSSDSKVSEAKAPDAKSASRMSGLPPWEELLLTSTHTSIDIAQTQYQAFTHPLRIAEGQDDQHDWVLGLLVPDNRFYADVAALSYGAVSWIPMSLVLLTLAGPLLKVRVMGRRDRLAAFDVHLLFVSLVGIGAVTTGLALEYYSYSSVEHSLDHELRHVSSEMQHRLHGEVVQAAASLELFSKWQSAPEEQRPEPLRVVNLFGVYKGNCDADEPRSPCCDRSYSVISATGRTCSCPTSPANAETHDCPPCPDGLGPVIEKMLETYPYFDTLTWTSTKEEKQLEKWTTKNVATALIPVSKFTWFKDFQAAHYWEVSRERDGADYSASNIDSQPAADEPPDLRVIMHQFVSPNTGQTVSVLATDRGPESGVATILPEMLSVSQPVLPDGFGFALIQNDGKVVWNSHPSRNLYENFFTETDQASVIRSAIEAGAEPIFEGSYHGRWQRFHIEPVEGSPWSLLVFFDKEMVRTIALDASITWIGCLAAYVACFLVLSFLARQLLPRDDRSWYWPDPAAAPGYDDVVLVLCANAVLAAAILARRPNPSAVGLLGVFAIVVASGAFVYLRLATAGGSHCTRGRVARRRIALCCLGVAAVLGVVAATADWALAVLVVSGALVVVLTQWRASRGVEPLGRSPWAWTAVGVGATVCFGLALLFDAAVIAAALGLLAALAWFYRWQLADPERPWRRSYFAAGMLFIVVAGILPSAALYQDAFEEGMEIFVRHGQVKLAEALDSRVDRLRQQEKEFGREHLIHRRIERSTDVYPSEIFGGPEGWQSITHGPAPDESAVAEQLAAVDATVAYTWQAALNSALGVLRPLRARAVNAAEHGSDQRSTDCDTTVGDETWAEHVWKRLGGEHFSLALMELLPIYDRESVAVRLLGDPDSCEGTWHWKKASPPVLSWRGLDENGHVQPKVITASVVVPHAVQVGSRAEWWWLLGLLAAGMAITCTVLRWLAANMFGLGQELEQRPPERQSELFAHGALLLGESEPFLASVPGLNVIDLRQRDIEADSHVLRDPVSQPCVVASHFEERLEQVDSVEKSRSMVEVLAARGDPLVLCSRIDPLGYLRRRFRSCSDAKGDKIPVEEIDRFARALERIMRIGLSRQQETGRRMLLEGVPADAATWIRWREENPDLRGFWPLERVRDLLDECACTPRLRGIAWEIWGTEDAPESTDEVVARVREAATAHYRTLWSLLTDEEQLTLFQLAYEGFVNPHNWDIVNILLRKGLLHSTPAIRLMNESFRRFVSDEETQERVRQLETAEGSGWDFARNLIVLVLMAGGLVLYVTEPDGMTRVAGLLTTISGAATKVAGWFDVFGGPRSKVPS